MSGICGVLRLDDRPIEPEAFSGMMEALSYWGPSGSGEWHDGPVWLGHLMLQGTRESAGDKLPRRSASGRHAITASARLDNREELARVLDARWKSMPDSGLILAAYERWGEDCADRLLGDWAFAIWDARDRRLFLARDHHGNTGLYYRHDPRFFAFASSLKGLLALPEVPRRPDALRIAQVLVSWPEHDDRTAYEGIQRLPPAHAMTVGEKGAAVRRYWRLEDAPRVRAATDRGYEDEFMEIYEEAVRCRLRCASGRSIGILLSGGLDSASVAALAGPEVQKRGEPLLAFTSVPCFDTNGLVAGSRFGDETQWVEATCRHVGNIRVSFIRAERTSPLDGIEHALRIHDQPVHAASNAFWICAALDAARGAGVGPLLTGQGGNATISWPGRQRLVRLARAGRWITLGRELRAWAPTQNLSLWDAVKGAVLRPLVPYRVLRSYQNFRSRGSRWAEDSAIRLEFARGLRLEERMIEAGHDASFTLKRDSRKARLDVLRPGLLHAGALWQEMGAAFGLEVRDPTFDKRVLEFCLGLPEDQYFRDGRERQLVRRAMQGRLPREVLWNPGRGAQGADIVLRVRESEPELRAALGALERCELAREYLDLRRMGRVLEACRTEANPGVTADCGSVLLRGMMVGLFLLGCERGRPREC